MFYEINIEGLKRKLPLFAVDENLSIAAFIIFGDVEMTEVTAGALLKKAPEFHIIITAEAKSIPLIYEMTKQAGMNDYVIARKGRKVYMANTMSQKVDSITTRASQELFLGEADAAKLKGQKVLIVDDVISTGESIKSLEKLVEAAGGSIAGKMAILAEGDAVGRDDIIVLEHLPLFNPDGSVKA